MSCNSGLYAANSNTQAITANTPTVISFGQIVRRFGCHCNLSGGNVSVQSSGFYDVDANFALSAAAGLVTIQLYQNGVPVPGAYATFTAAANTIYSVTIPAIVRNKCCCEETLTAVITSVGAAAITNAAIKVEKI